MRVPRALKQDTVLEFAVEMRFTTSHESADTLIPGMVFGALQGKFLRSSPLALAQLPKALREKDATFTYFATTALEAQDFKLLLGARSAVVSFTAPYPGWSIVRSTILECFRAVHATSLLTSVERVSMRYVNIVGNESNQYAIDQLNVEIRLDGFSLRGPGTAVRAEVEQDNCISIIEIQSGLAATVRKPASTQVVTGVGLNVDSIRSGPFASFEDELEGVLEQLHNRNKQVFFSLLKEQTLAALGPEWDG